MANKILVIDDTKVDITEKRSSQVNDASQYMTLEQIVSSGGAQSGYTYTEVEVSSAEILAIGSSPIVLLPAVAGVYYTGVIHVEYTYGTVAYSHSPGSRLILYGTTTNDMSIDLMSLNGVTTDVVSVAHLVYVTNYPGEGVKLTTELAATPADGDGTLFVKVWYKTNSFGTEL